MSGGRFRLGLGAGVKRLNETWHNVEYGKPAPHLRETIEATRLIMEQASSGEPIRFEGEYQDIDIKGWIRPHKPVRDRVPIYTAAMREGMCRMAGDVADGLIGHPMCPPRWLDEVVIPSFEEGLKRSGRQRSDLDFLPTVCCAIDDDEARAIDAARRTIAFYSTVRTYQPLWEMHGFADARRPRATPSARETSPPSRRHIPDEMVEAYTAAGPLDKVRARVEEVAERGDGVLLTPADLLHPARAAGRVPAEDRRGVRPQGVPCSASSAVALVEAVDELDELARVPNRGAVPEEDELRLEGSELFRRAAVLSGVRGQVGLRLVQAGDPGHAGPCCQHVAQDQHAVGLPPVGDMTGGVARGRRAP